MTRQPNTLVRYEVQYRSGTRKIELVLMTWTNADGKQNRATLFKVPPALLRRIRCEERRIDEERRLEAQAFYPTHAQRNDLQISLEAVRAFINVVLPSRHDAQPN